MKIRAVAVLLAASVWCAMSVVDATAAAPAGAQVSMMHRDGQAVDYPSFGVKLAAPRGWAQVSEGSVDRIVRWVKPDGSGRPTAILEVAHGRVAGTLEQEAAAIKKSMTVTKLEATRIDGEDAILAQGETAQNSVQVVVALRDKVKYIATLLRPKGGDDSVVDADADVMKAFIDNWKWRDVEEPFEHVSFMPQPMAVLGAVRINLPAAARPDAVDSTKTQIHFTLINLKTEDDEFHVRLSLRDGPVPTVDALDAQLKDKLAPDARLLWSAAGDNAVLTRWAKTSTPGRALWLAVGMARVNDRQTAVVTFALDREEEDVQRAYADVARRVMESIGPQ